jgi:SnoaL-like domain
MSTKLSEPMATYFAGHNNHDVDAMIGTFAESATVKDEGQERRGLPAIRKWMEESNAKYTVTVVVINCRRDSRKHNCHRPRFRQLPR